MKMKKLCVALICAMAMGAAFADESETGTKKWTNVVGVSLSVPFTHFDTDAFGTVNQTALGVTGSYLGYARNGITVKGTFSLGGAFTGDVPLGSDTDFKGGMYADMSLGAGYSFVRTEKWLVSARLLFALSISRYTQESETVTDAVLGEAERVYSAALFNLAFGADITAAYRVGKSMSVCAGVQFRWIPGGVAFRNVMNGTDDYARIDVNTSDICDSFQIAPSLGLVWSL